MQIIELELEHGNHDRLSAVEGLEEVELKPGKKVTVGQELNTAVMAELLNCLSSNIDVFTWNVEDMLGIDLEIAVHKLNVNTEARPVKQRKRQFAPERREVIKEEIAKLVNARFIREVQYPDWLVNVVLLLGCFFGVSPNTYGGRRSREDLIHGKLSHLLLQGHALWTKECWSNVSKVGKQHLAELIEKMIEGYVDDMVVKSKQVNSHVSDLEGVFSTLWRYNIKLNPAKCAFGVASGKFLGFMITNREIEANPDKIQALINMEASKCRRDIQRLTGCIATLNRFVSRAVDKCFPFFKLLRENKSFDWNEKCNLAFQELKQTLATPPVLTKPEPGDTLLLYLVISQNAISGVLVKEKERVQQPIYYLHPTVVFTNQPFRHILQKPNVSGRLLRWAIELGVFDIVFEPRAAIKAQALADFIAELTLRTPKTQVAKADVLSRLIFMGVDGLDRTVHVKIVAEPIIVRKPSVMDIDHEPSWMDPIVDYISNGNLHVDPRLARSIRYRTTSYCLIEGVRFRRSFTLPYLRCLKPFESLQALTKIHEGICENHQGARALACKLIRFGIPKVLIIDNGRQFDNPQFRSFYANHGIDHRLTSVSHPQSNGLVEVTNRIILQDLQTRIGDAKGDWPNELPFILWAYRTSHKTATGETPFMLAFGLEATISIEVSLSTIRKLEMNRERQTTEHLDLLEEVREQASLRAASYQNRTKKHFNNKVQMRKFRAGDLVFRKAETVGHQPGKLRPTWEGPFEVIRKLKDGAYSLRDTSGKPLPRPWNADNLKIYYK
ncbi:uncharacterized protein LOC111408138 [Olea europaea var. sylvestris]|uniref:uncharacterized protein LOC111408138 n=1 Tax=Olea europaea var. sylvestris TaxID=158386 RepID=UPI000C1CF1DB|nr:uncharacterized protein LOC111408138 [Olea europaea var. sylvestris]